MKVKLRDMTEEQYKKWEEQNCCGECDTCTFRSVNCHPKEDGSWLCNKDLYSDKFLNQEVEINEKILTKGEHKYLLGIIGSLEKEVSGIKKKNPRGYDMWEEVVIIEFEDGSLHITPGFDFEEYFKGMELNRTYTPEELGL